MEALRSIFRPVLRGLDALLKWLGIPEQLVVLSRNVLLVLGLVLLGRLCWAGWLERRPAPDQGASVQDLAGQTQEALAKTLQAAIAAAAAQYKARDPGETLCYLAAQGEVDTAAYLLRQGVDVNSQDRFGQTPLMHAAASRQADLVEFLLASGADVERLDQSDCCALVHAYSAGNNSRVIDLLWLQGATVRTPGSDGYPADGLYVGLSAPPALDVTDVRDIVSAYDGLMQSPVSGILRAAQPVLTTAIDRVDVGPQLNEPYVQRRTLEDRLSMQLLVMNAAIGGRSAVVPLYERDLWRNHELPPAVMKQVDAVRALRKQHAQSVDPDGRLVQAVEVATATRRLNALIVQHLVGAWVNIDLPEAVPGGSGKVSAVPSVPPNAPSWVTKPLQPYEYEDKSLDEIQDMINELSAAGGLIFPGPGLNNHFRALGYVQLTAEPQFTSVQKANFDLLVARRAVLRALPPKPEAPEAPETTTSPVPQLY